MTNEQIVSDIRNGISVTDNMQSLYEKNLPLIKKIVKPYTAYEPMEDLLNESYFGLWEAVQHYETSENVLFMTYAPYWIKQSVQRYLENCGSVVRIPTHTRAKITHLRKTIDRIRQEQGREPTAAEIADCMGASVEQVQEIQGYMQGVASLDTPLTEDSSLTLADTLQAEISVENETIDKMYDEYAKNELWDIVEHYTAERENEIIKEIFLHRKSMSQVARERNISIERIRQTKEKGLRRLRMGKAKRELLKKFDYVESRLYHGSFKGYCEHEFTSIVEHAAIIHISAEERYKRHLAEVEEMNKKRLSIGLYENC